MLSATFKSVIETIQRFADKKTVILGAMDKKSGVHYLINVRKDQLQITTINGDFEVVETIRSIEMYRFPTFLTITRWSDELYDFRNPNNIYKSQFVNIKYEAQLFVELFRLMSERAIFSVRARDAYIDLYYIEGKVFYIEETEDSYNLMGTNLYKLSELFPDYRITAIGPLPIALDYSTFSQQQNDAASLLRKSFRKYKNGVLMKGGVHA